MVHARNVNHLLNEFKRLAQEGQMQLLHRPLPDEPYCISFFDASLGKSDSFRAQQGQVHFLSTTQALESPAIANIVEFRSSKIVRVVKSSLAAEGNSLSTAADEQLYLRLLAESALFDHLQKTGHLTAERQSDDVGHLSSQAVGREGFDVVGMGAYYMAPVCGWTHEGHAGRALS